MIYRIWVWAGALLPSLVLKMTRHRSRADETEAQIAARELSRGRTKESLAWDLVTTHDVELKHVTRRLDLQDAAVQGIMQSLSEIKMQQTVSATKETQILNRLDSIVDEKKLEKATVKDETRWSSAKRNDLIRNLIAFAMLLITLTTIVLSRCN